MLSEFVRLCRLISVDYILPITKALSAAFLVELQIYYSITANREDDS